MAAAEPPDARLRAAILELLDGRRPESSICPSEAARAVGAQRWRDLMPAARQAAAALARAGQVEVTQRGVVLDPDGIWHGPVRIRRPRA